MNVFSEVVALFSKLFKKSRIRISGSATLRKHNLLTQPRREEERAWFIK
jgi:hypothetical protein